MPWFALVAQNPSIWLSLNVLLFSYLQIWLKESGDNSAAQRLNYNWSLDSLPPGEYSANSRARYEVPTIPFPVGTLYLAKENTNKAAAAPSSSSSSVSLFLVWSPGGEGGHWRLMLLRQRWPQEIRQDNFLPDWLPGGPGGSRGSGGAPGAARTVLMLSRQ